MTLLQRIKMMAKGVPLVQRWVIDRGARKLERAYAALSDHYCELARVQKLSWRDEDIRAQVAARPALRDKKRKRHGEVHTFLIDDNTDYTMTHIVPALERAGKCSRVDWRTAANALPHERPDWHGDAPQTIHGLIGQIEESHAAQPVDLIFCSCCPGTLGNEALRRLSELHLPTASYWADDKQNFLQHMGGEPGNVPQAALFDLCWTTSSACVPWYVVEGGRAISMPEGADQGTFFVELPTEFRYGVSFVGKRYGTRAEFIAYLRRRGIDVSVSGSGWGESRLTWREMALTFAQSRINLGFAATGHSPRVPTLKGRDFEVPMSGGLYLAAFSEELARHYRVNEEIVCYNSREECVDVIRHLLVHPDLCQEIRRRGQERALRDHTWDARFIRLMDFMGLLEAPSGGP